MTLQQEIIQALGAKPAVDAHEEIRRSVDFLKAYLKKNSFLKSLVLGISGGQDSTLTGKLCQMAISELREETGDETLQFIAVRLPYGVQADEQDCQDAIAFIQPDRVLTVNIKGSVLASEQALREAGIELSDFVRGNEKARERMKAQYSIAGMTKGVVVGTDHAAEAITGFFTKYGDGGTDINPIFRLNKRQGKQLLALTFVQAEDRVNVGAAVAIFGEEAGDRFGRMVGADHDAFGHPGDAVLRFHALACLFIAANEIAQLNARFA